MARKIETYMTAWQGNVWPAMLESLGAHLNVTAESLARLDLGWAPIVEFKKGKNFQGWWAIPERDENAGLTGVSLRSRQDMKVMAPGSKHGLIYEVNPHHELGSKAYKHGAHNWARVADVGVECPVCGKPDGCLVSAEDPDNPKAAVCIRTEEGSEKRLKFGYLHLLKEEGKISRQAHVLPPSDRPVIVVEGMTDTAAAMDMGFVAVGRPSNLACMDMLKDLLRGRRVIVVGENDDINPTTGKRPGEEGMVAAFQMLRNVCPDTTMVLPPAHLKDLRQWKTRESITAADLIAYAGQHGRKRTEQTILPDAKPSTMARMWLDSQHRMAGRYTLRFLNDQWFKYTGPKYTEADEKTDIRGPLYQWSDDKLVLSETQNGSEKLDPVICNRHLVSNVMDALYSPEFAPLDIQRPPGWINGATGPDPTDIIPFRNGLLWVSKYLEGADESEYFLDSTPDYFTTFALPWDFDPLATCPNWMKFMRSTLLHDRDRYKLIQEWIGYCLTPDTSKQKMMLLRGPKRSGKGTILRVLHEIVGREQAADLSLRKLTEQFGLQNMVGKQVALMNEAILPRHGDGNVALELLLKIVGEDVVDIPRKFKTSLGEYKLPTRITMSANAIPQIPDDNGALESRLLIVDFDKSFEGREDYALTEKLKAEAPGVLLWALEGLRRLRAQGRFTTPESMKTALAEWRTSTSPTAAFLEEVCVEGPRGEHEVGKHELYECWSQWSRERGLRPVAKTRFFEKIKNNAPFATTDTYTKGGHKFSVYRGLSLMPWAERQYLGKVHP